MKYKVALVCEKVIKHDAAPITSTPPKFICSQEYIFTGEMKVREQLSCGNPLWSEQSHKLFFFLFSHKMITIQRQVGYDNDQLVTAGMLEENEYIWPNHNVNTHTHTTNFSFLEFSLKFLYAPLFNLNTYIYPT